MNAAVLPHTGVARKRCAVYTRKSTEEGLDQAFNSIDAQREAGQAYIASQRAEGWIPVTEDYDDPAYSGGNMERPALQRLLADIERGKIDIVVVYKIDRLSRSLADFARMVEIFDRHGVSFSAVTQQINSATSMGRLMLNVLYHLAGTGLEGTARGVHSQHPRRRAGGVGGRGMNGPRSNQSFVPLQLRRSKGRLVDTERTGHEPLILEAIGRALHWQALLESGAVASHRELAQRE